MYKIQRKTIATILLLSMTVSTSVTDGTDMIRIADPSEDYGYQTPHGHYPRGSGYIQMILIFDTLIICVIAFIVLSKNSINK